MRDYMITERRDVSVTGVTSSCAKKTALGMRHADDIVGIVPTGAIDGHGKRVFR